ncbi:MAG: PDZ domain-containing protein [Acidobacteriota bacterium]
MTIDRPTRRLGLPMLGLGLVLSLLPWAAPVAAQNSSTAAVPDDESQEVIVVNQRVEVSADADGEGIRRCRALVLTDGEEQEFRCEMRTEGSGPPRAVFFDADGNEIELENEHGLKDARMNAFFIGDAGVRKSGTDVQVIGFGDAGKPRGYLGAQLTDLTPELREHFGAPGNRGVLLARIEPESPAAEAGLRVGDVLTAIDGEAMRNSAAVRRHVRALQAGDTAVLDLWRNRKLLRPSVTFVEKAVPEVDVRRLLWHEGEGSAFAYQVNRPQVEDAILELHRSLPANPCADLEKRLQEMERKIELLSQQLESD